MQLFTLKGGSVGVVAFRKELIDERGGGLKGAGKVLAVLVLGVRVRATL